MADIDENMRTFLLSDSTLAALTTSIHVNRVPENEDDPYVWINLSDTETDINLDGTTGPTITTFLIEATSVSLATAKAMQLAIKNKLHGASGAFGTQTIAYGRVDSLGDSYISRQQFGDVEDFHIAALTCFIGTDARS
jgi:hypothetical protein